MKENKNKFAYTPPTFIVIAWNEKAVKLVNPFYFIIKFLKYLSVHTFLP